MLSSHIAHAIALERQRDLLPDPRTLERQRSERTVRDAGSYSRAHPLPEQTSMNGFSAHERDARAAALHHRVAHGPTPPTRSTA
jgi:hypothetical protein